MSRRPSKEAAEAAIRRFLVGVDHGSCPVYTVEDGDDDSAPGKCGWAFWCECPDTTTSYVHEDLSIEYY